MGSFLNRIIYGHADTSACSAPQRTEVTYAQIENEAIFQTPQVIVRQELRTKSALSHQTTFSQLGLASLHKTLELNWCGLRPCGWNFEATYHGEARTLYHTCFAPKVPSFLVSTISLYSIYNPCSHQKSNGTICPPCQ